MAGRTHRAKPGEPTCGVGDCDRPAGFATETPGVGPCRRHGGPASRTSSTTTLAPRPAETLAAPEKRLRGDGRPTPDPLALVRILMVHARRAGFSFEDAWRVATVTALHHMSDRRASEWWDALSATERAWADAYLNARSPLALLPREIPQPVGATVSLRSARRSPRGAPM